MHWKLILLIAAVFIILYSLISIDSVQKNEELITVEIRGEVEKEGLYEMKRGSSVSDLIELSTLKDEADISTLSLQRTLYHKQLIVIPKKKEQKLISINSADIYELILLPGIGEKMAEKIIEYRLEYGCFHHLEDIMNVKGIGKAKYEKIKGYISL